MENSGEEIPLLRLLPMLQRIVSLADIRKDFGITKSQMVIFLVLYYRKSMTMSGIAEYLSSSKEQATRAVAALCDHGLVERFEDPCNRTHVYIRFTDEGKEYMQQLLLRLHTEVSQKLTASLSEEDMQTLCRSVQTSVEILSKVK